MPTPFQQRATERRAKIVAEVEAAKKTLEDATTVGAGFWVSYIFLMFYIAVSAGAVTHVGLLMEDPVKLPFLNLELPLLGFFFLAPILFIIMHVFTLSKLVMLAEKSRRFLEALEKLPTPEAREKLRRSLPSNIFTQFMAGPTELSGGAFGGLLRLMGWITMALGPILLLLFLQIQFLPYHSVWLTWEHRAALLVDLLLLWWLWRRALQTSRQATTSEPAAPAGRWERAKDLLSREARFVALLLGLVLSAGVLFASLVATYPTEWETSPLAFAPRLEAHRAALTEAIFGEKSLCGRPPVILRDYKLFGVKKEISQSTKASGVNMPFPRWPCNTLQLEEFNIFEAFKLEDHDKLGGRDFTVRLRNRRLEGANLSRAKLGKAYLSEAKLKGATLDEADLQGVTLDNAELQDATLIKAKLQRATLIGTKLQRATLDEAELQDANLYDAKLQGASLIDAKLQRAKFNGAVLQGAKLSRAVLQGAEFYGAEMQSAILGGAKLQGAHLDNAKLQGATLNDAEMQGATLNEAEMQGATLSGAVLQGAMLRSTELSGAVFYHAKLQGAMLMHTWLNGSVLDYAELQGATLYQTRLHAASLSETLLWRADFDEAYFTILGLGAPVWKPVTRPFFGKRPWTNSDYEKLKTELIAAIPQSSARDDALNRIERLRCEETKGGRDCRDNPTAGEKATREQIMVTIKRVTAQAYAQELASELKDLVCPRDDNAIYILRGLISNNHLAHTAANAPKLVDDILSPEMNSECSVSEALTAADKDQLLKIKATALAKYAPQPTPKEDATKR